MNKPINYFRYANRFGFKKSSMFWLIGLGLSAMAFEAIGISIFLPIFQYARLEGNAALLTEQGQFWNKAIEIFGYVGLELNLGTLLATAMTAFLLRQCFFFLSSIYRTEIQARFIKGIRDRFFRRYLDADTEYQEEASAGDLANALTVEVNRAASMIVSPIDIVINLLIAILYMTILMAVSFSMTVTAIAILAIATQLPRYWIRKSIVMGRRQAGVNSELSQYLLQRLHHPRLMRLEGTSKRESEDFSRFTELQKRIVVSKFILKTKTQLVVEPFVIFASLVFVYFAISLYKMPLELIGVYLVIALRLIPITKSILGLWQGIKGNVGSFENVNDRFQMMTHHREKETGTLEFTGLKNAIELKNVTYSYPGAKVDALTGISASIPAGKVTALVGASGSGKSTLVDLLPRLRKPVSGEIWFDGELVDQFTLTSLRDGIRYVPQMASIYSGTIKEHICYGRTVWDEARVERVLQTVGLADFVDKLPEGLNTPLGEHGQRLSGGQKQRLELARAMVAEVGLLILDEPTSGLDAIGESEFHKVLARINKEHRTTIIYIAHSLRFVSSADQIIVLRNGRVEGQGSHDEAIKLSEWYARACRISGKGSESVQALRSLPS